jgi:hypothetical protein
MDFKLDQYFMWIHAYYDMQVTDGLGNYESVSWWKLYSDKRRRSDVDGTAYCFRHWLHMGVDLTIWLFHWLLFAWCAALKNWRFVLLTVDKTERVCKSRGNRYASLLGANVCGCDFTDFCWKLSERKTIRMICNPSLMAPDSGIYCVRTGKYSGLFVSLPLPSS